MVNLTIKGVEYECKDEKALAEELRAEGIEPNRIIEKYFDPEVTRIFLEQGVWMVNGYVLSKILDRIPNLFNKKD